VIALLVLAGASAINVLDFGAKPNTSVDSGPAFARACQACREQHAKKLIIPPGEYHVYADGCQNAVATDRWGRVSPISKAAFYLHDLENLTIEANGAKLQMHGLLAGIVLDHVKHVQIDGLSIDASRPSIFEALVTKADGNSTELRLTDPSLPLKTDSHKLLLEGEGWEKQVVQAEIVDPATGEVIPNTGDLTFDSTWPSDIALDGNGNIKLSGRPPRTLRPGAVMILRAGSGPHGILMLRSNDLTFRDTRIAFCFGMGFVGEKCTNVRLIHCAVVPASGRHFSAAIDATHWIQMRGNLEIRDCTFKGQLDDSANVHGFFAEVSKVVSPQTVDISIHKPLRYGIEPADEGDSLEFFDPNLVLPYGESVVTEIKPLSEGEYELSFSAPVPAFVTRGTLVDNETWNPDVLYATNTDMCHRARGVLIKTRGHVSIINNHFRTPGAAIAIAADFQRWHESGPVNDVRIEGNRFDMCNTSNYEHGKAVISIDPVLPESAESHPALERGISIVHNSFVISNQTVLWALSADGLTFADNKIEGGAGTYPLIDLDLCKNVLIAQPGLKPDRIHASRMGPDDLTVVKPQ